MKKLILTLSLAVVVLSVSAQTLRFDRITYPEPVRVEKNNHWSVEFNTAFFMTPVNAIWEYDCAKWFQVGAGAGLFIPSIFGIVGVDAFGRVGFDVLPNRKVSPYFDVDFGLMLIGEFWSEFYLTAFVSPSIGIKIRQYNYDRLSFGISTVFFDDSRIIPMLRVGYTF